MTVTHCPASPSAEYRDSEYSRPSSSTRRGIGNGAFPKAIYQIIISQIWYSASEIRAVEKMIFSTPFVASTNSWSIATLGGGGMIEIGYIFRVFLRRVWPSAKKISANAGKVDVNQRHSRLLPILLSCIGI